MISDMTIKHEGRVPERSIGAVLKTVRAKARTSSNLVPSEKSLASLIRIGVCLANIKLLCRIPVSKHLKSSKIKFTGLELRGISSAKNNR